MFGPVPDDFYGLVGRIALMAALLDDRLLSLARSIRAEPEEEHAGRPSAELARLARHGLVRHEPELQTELTALIDRTMRAIERRHQVIHSIWPNPTLESARGWRSVIHRRRPQASTYVQWIEVDEAQLRNLITELVDLIAAYERTFSRVPYRPAERPTG
jgi:hypothetical protein